MVLFAAVLAAAAAQAAGPCVPGTAGAAPAQRLNVRDYGARGDSEHDDTQAIERALAALEAGGCLLFPDGVYRHRRRLVLDRPRSTIAGAARARLHATDPADSALLIQADGVRVIGLTLTATTDRRRSAPWESRIAVWRHGEDLAPLHDIEIRGNRIVAAGPPGSPLANSSSSAAIFVHNATRFVVAGNTVERSLSDGVHVTGGAHMGCVVGNTVRESGDDMVAVVSYLGRGNFTRESAAAVASEFAHRRARALVHDIVIADNDVAGQYWGRGISVVGGENITIAANRIADTAHAAGIYIAREQGYVSFGVRNVLVTDNAISQVQTRPPAYSVLAPERRERKTGHAAIEIVAHLFDDEREHDVLRDALTIREVAIVGNRVDGSATAGIRIGDGWGERQLRSGRDAAGAAVQRASSGASVGSIDLVGNRLQQVRGAAIDVRNAGDPALDLHCADNVDSGRALRHAACGAARHRVSGAAPACPRTQAAPNAAGSSAHRAQPAPARRAAE